MKFEPKMSIAEWPKFKLDELLDKGAFMYTYGDGLEIKPDQRFTALSMALRGYYATYNPSISDSGEGGHTSVPKVYAAVIFMSFFLEQYIISHFDLVDSSVSRKANGRTVRFSDILIVLEKRLESPEDYLTSRELKFFKDKVWVVRIFSELRNSIAHDCNSLPYLQFLDVLYVNHLAPLLIEILDDADFDTQSIDRPTFCGIQVLRTLSELKIVDCDIENGMSFNNRKLKHLKALGKAALDSLVYHPTREEDSVWCEENNRPLQNLMESRTRDILNEADVLNAFVCPCCGTKSLITMGWRVDRDDKYTRPVLANCQTCKYTVEWQIGEPYEFGIMNEDVFLPILKDVWLEMRGAKEHLKFWSKHTS